MYRNTLEAVKALEKEGMLVRLKEEINPDLVLAEVHRRVSAGKGPALLFENVSGTPFPCVSNMFATSEHAKFLFRDSWSSIEKLMQIKGGLRKPSFSNLFNALPALRHSLPKKINAAKADVLKCKSSISQLPQIKCWPDDGGAFITLPQVYSEDPEKPGIMKSNLGMYRVQLSGNDYQADKEVGLHYQIHRGIGVHHAKAKAKGEKLRVAIYVGGPPANTLSAVMPLPEGMPEAAFAGLLNKRRWRHCNWQDWTIAAEADFCIVGTVSDKLKPEGPFGDHLGYYSLTHDLPFLEVEAVFHREDAIWPLTIVGRPPQEDSIFGEVIHELTGPVIPSEIPGIRAIHAIDAAGVHPLLLAIGSERYTPWSSENHPQEILTQSHSVLGKGQLSLAKYLFIIADGDEPAPDINDIPAYFSYLLERVDFTRDLHFHTRTTIDTLDYSGEGFNRGSKLVIATCGSKKRTLCQELPQMNLPAAWKQAKLVLPGIVAISGLKWAEHESATEQRQELALQLKDCSSELALIILCDDAEFCAADLDNFLWLCFTRSNPAVDIDGVNASTINKHWGCEGALIIDARLKSHHAPPLIVPDEISKAADEYMKKESALTAYINN